MRKHGLILLVILIASASLLAAAAYNTAVVTNAASIKVVDTTEGLLRLTPGEDLDETAWVDENGQLVIDFSKSNWRGKGLQPGSVYYWEDLFYIRSGSRNPVRFKVELYTKDGRPFESEKVFITIWNDRNTGSNLNGTPAGHRICYVEKNVNKDVWDSDEPFDFNKPIDVQVEVLEGACLDVLHELQLVVKAEKK